MSSSREHDSGFELFNTSGINIPVITEELSSLLSVISEDQECEFSYVEIAFVDDEEIIKINKEFLDRSYVTDIISFRYDEDETNQAIEGTLYCCAQRIKEQSIEYKQQEKTEFYRVISHGLVHLLGYDDQTETDKSVMTELENKYLEALSFI